MPSVSDIAFVVDVRSPDVLQSTSSLLDKTQAPLRFGILGAARIGPDALFTPAKTHPQVTVMAVACRDEARGSKYARQHHIPKVHSGPQAYHGLSCLPDSLVMR